MNSYTDLIFIKRTSLGVCSPDYSCIIKTEITKEGYILLFLISIIFFYFIIKNYFKNWEKYDKNRK